MSSGQTEYVLKSLLCWERNLDYFIRLHFSSPELSQRDSAVPRTHWAGLAREQPAEPSARASGSCVWLWGQGRHWPTGGGQLRATEILGSYNTQCATTFHWTGAVAPQGQLKCPNIPWLSSQDVLLCGVLGIQPSRCGKGKTVQKVVDLILQRCAAQTENGRNMKSHEILWSLALEKDNFSTGGNGKYCLAITL